MMKIEEAYECSLPTQYLTRLAWLKDNMIHHMISCDKTLEEIKAELYQSPETLSAEDRIFLK